MVTSKRFNIDNDHTDVNRNLDSMCQYLLSKNPNLNRFVGSSFNVPLIPKLETVSFENSQLSSAIELNGEFLSQGL